MNSVDNRESLIYDCRVTNSKSKELCGLLFHSLPLCEVLSEKRGGTKFEMCAGKGFAFTKSLCRATRPFVYSNYENC